MSKSAWGLLLALVASNAAWIATAPDDAPAPRARAASFRPGASPPRPGPRAEAARADTSPAGPSTRRESRGAADRGPDVAANRATVWKRAGPWISDLKQIEDPSRHRVALAEIREALRSEDPIAVEAGLLALTQTRLVHYDHASFRPLVLPHLTSTSPGVRLAALYALVNTKSLPEDAARIVRLAGDPVPEIRTSVPHVLVTVTKGDFTGAPGEALLKLLHDPDYDLVVDAMRGIGGVRKCPPEVVDRLLELASDRKKRLDVLHFALMNMPKSKRVIDAMLRYLDDRAALQTAGMGLQRGVPQRLRDYLCAKILARMDEADAYAQGVYLEILSFNAEVRHRKALQRLIDQEIVVPRYEAKVKEIVRRLR